MVLVKVYRISSTNDPETGRPGRIIELVEIRRQGERPGMVTEETLMLQRLMQGVFLQMQSMGLLPHVREVVIPKMTLFLTEEEYEMLNVKLEVNYVYELQFKDGKITFVPT
ncbi:MAG: arcadin 1 [Nitrososphaerota archaeon]|nr:arcadin 1 [Aigarchaeota archaeon]MDW8076381.1 arcadin 1 [Nitrososphaerota archaeon]